MPIHHSPDHRRLSASPLTASIEVTPTQAATSDILPGLLPAGTPVYLTDLGGGADDKTVDAAMRLRRLGYEPVPHIAVRRIANRNAITDLLARYHSEAGVSDVLIIGGSVDAPLGPFASAIDFLETGLLDRYGITRIGVAGHPEGSPDIAPQVIEAALRLKADFARRTGANMRIVTQFSFDPASTIKWLEELGAAGFDLPVHLGVAGPAKITTLLKYAAMCGVGPSLGFLRRGAGLLTALATRYSPEAYVEPVERWHNSAAGSVLAAIHVFPFGGLGASAGWLIERGSLATPNREGSSTTPENLHNGAGL